MPRVNPITRRQFLTLGGGVAATSLFGGAFLVSGCPLSNSEICVGPCGAFLDLDGDGICDRIQRRAVEIQQAACTTPDCLECANLAPEAMDPAHVGKVARCPLGLVNDPYPGQCGRYVDADGNGICDLSEVAPEEDVASPTFPSPAPTAIPQPTPGAAQGQPTVACPFGFVNDSYPGKCRRYVDQNGNGICDLSEPGAQPAPDELPDGSESGGSRRQRRGRGGG